MKLKPGIGIENIKFGMTQDQIEKILGTPNKIKLDSNDSDRLILEFNSYNLRLTIYKDEENRLGYITTTNIKTTYRDELIIGRTIESVEQNVFNELITNWEIDEYDYWKTYGEYKYWITLNVEFEKVISVELGVNITDENKYNWPE